MPDLAYITSADIAGFRDHSAKELSTRTANNRLKTIKIPFQQAWRDSILTDNPAAKVPILKSDGSQSRRRSFTIAELSKLLSVADGEWPGLILFGIYTAQRLGDIARLEWASIDLGNQTISLTTQKTGRRQILPIAPPLERWLCSQPQEGRRGPLFPHANDSVTRAGKVSTLSRQFYDLLAEAGLVDKRPHRKCSEDGAPSKRRVTSQLSFHALRHTATSLMKNAGASPAIVQEFVGHDSKEISDLCTHIDTASLRQGTEALPDISPH